MPDRYAYTIIHTGTVIDDEVHPEIYANRKQANAVARAIFRKISGDEPQEAQDVDGCYSAMIHKDADEDHDPPRGDIYEYVKVKMVELVRDGEQSGAEEDWKLAEDEEEMVPSEEEEDPEDYEDYYDNDESGVEEISKEEFKDSKRRKLNGADTGTPEKTEEAAAA